MRRSALPRGDLSAPRQSAQFLAGIDGNANQPIFFVSLVFKYRVFLKCLQKDGLRDVLCIGRVAQKSKGSAVNGVNMAPEKLIELFMIPHFAAPFSAILLYISILS